MTDSCLRKRSINSIGTLQRNGCGATFNIFTLQFSWKNSNHRKLILRYLTIIGKNEIAPCLPESPKWINFYLLFVNHKVCNTIISVNFKERYRLARPKRQGLANGNNPSILICDLDVVACGLFGLAHTVCFRP